MSEVTKRKIHFIMVLHPLNGWVRVGKAYSTRATAQEWRPFVSKAWRGCRTKVAQFTAVFRDGKLDEKSKKTLDRKFNMDAPDPA